MNPLIRTDPLLNLAYLGLGMISALAGIWIIVAAKFLIVQGLGLILLLPAGVFLAIGVCRLCHRLCCNAKIRVPAIAVPLNRTLTFSGALRTLAAARKPDEGWDDSRGGAPGWIVRAKQ